MALAPILNSGIYKISNYAYGAIRNDEGALGAVGNSKSTELVWLVTRNEDCTYTLSCKDEGTVTLRDAGTAAGPGIAISEIEQRYYISVEGEAPARWRLQPILTGSYPSNPSIRPDPPKAAHPPVLFVIYQDPNDDQGQAARTGRLGPLGHWELNNSDKKEPVKLNRHPDDQENKPVPSLYGGNALWIFDPQPEGIVADSDRY